MRLRPATIEDFALLSYWDTKPHVREAGGDDSWFEWESELRIDPPWRELLIAEFGERPVGVLQIIDPLEEETHYWGDVEPNQRAIDIWIGEEDDLGQGFGTQMMRGALERCFAPPEVTNVLIDPLLTNEKAHAFYRKLGFRATETRVFERDECLIFEMTRGEWERIRAH